MLSHREDAIATPFFTILIFHFEINHNYIALALTTGYLNFTQNLTDCEQSSSIKLHLTFDCQHSLTKKNRRTHESSNTRRIIHVLRKHYKDTRDDILAFFLFFILR